MTMNFGSDNQAGVSPAILQTLVQAASGIQSAYGNDDWCARAEQMLCEAFDTPLKAFFVATGTAANCLALSTVAQPWNAVVCHDMAHIAVDENSAPEWFTGGARLLPLATGSGKVLADDLDRFLASYPASPPHNMLPSAVSISQVSENGLVYQPHEVAALAASAHARGLRLHMDGARLANAVAALGCHPADITCKAGVDVLSLGASKNGALMAEAVVFFDDALAEHFRIRQKRAGQLVSKSRLIGAQYCAWLQDDHWLQLARQANASARSLADALVATQAARLAWPAEANEVFAILPRALHAQLVSHGVRCADWYDTSVPPGTALAADEMVVRFVASWSSTSDEVQALAGLVRRLA
ncbi:threonine aldolase family protein [Comamonas odontotermitis]|uniref:threonine aldolase family protein n=1 Tax=Comamonas odontotermitis TaxID=379895 RepID=UPI00375247C7